MKKKYKHLSAKYGFSPSNLFLGALQYGKTIELYICGKPNMLSWDAQWEGMIQVQGSMTVVAIVVCAIIIQITWWVGN